MRITSLEAAHDFVRRYHTSNQPRRYATSPEQTWDVGLEACTFLTTSGKPITTSLRVQCAMRQATANTKEAALLTRQRTAQGLMSLAELLMRIFVGKRGFPGYHGWFQCTEIVSVFDPRKHGIVSLTKRSAS